MGVVFSRYCACLSSDDSLNFLQYTLITVLLGPPDLEHFHETVCFLWLTDVSVVEYLSSILPQSLS